VLRIDERRAGRAGDLRRVEQRALGARGEPWRLLGALIDRTGTDRQALIASIEERLPEPAQSESDQIPGLSATAQRALLDAAQVARASGSTFIDPEHVLFALALNADAMPGQLLASAGVTPQSLQAAASSEASSGTATGNAPDEK